MPLLSYAEAKASFGNAEDLQYSKCIASSRDRRIRECILLHEDRIVEARRLFHQEKEQLNLEDVRDLINYILCEKCHNGYKIKDNVENQWKSEFRPNFFASPRSHSRTKLSPRRARSAPACSQQQPDCTPCTSSRIRPSTSEDQSSLAGSQQLTGPSFGARVRTQSSGRLFQHTLDQVIDVEDDSRNTPAGDDSPSIGRGRRARCTHGPLHLEQEHRLPNMERENSPSSTPHIDRAPETNAQGATPANEDVSSTDRAPSEPSHVTDTEGPFTASPASTGARSKQLLDLVDVMMKPISRSREVGYIYAVPVRSRPGILKIGRSSTEKAETRFNNIRRQQGQELDVHTAVIIRDVPNAQLKRLEDLVHLYFVYCQRHVPHGRGRTASRHHEYYKVDRQTAQHAIQKIWNFMERYRPHTQGTLRPEVMRQLQASLFLELDITEIEIGPLARSESNNHQYRSDTLDAVLQTCRRSLCKPVENMINVCLVWTVVSIFLRDLTMLTPQKLYGPFVLAGAGLMVFLGRPVWTCVNRKELRASSRLD